MLDLLDKLKELEPSLIERLLQPGHNLGAANCDAKTKVRGHV